MSEVSPVAERQFVRMTLNQRIQHFLLMISFFTLVLTGFPVSYPNFPGSSILIKLMGGFGMRSIIHRVAAALLIGLCVYHLFYLAFSKHGRSEIKALRPGLKDLHDLIGMIKFYLGLQPSTPRFDRFNFIEKFEYLALGWGSVVMIVTGLMLWFQDRAMAFVPKWAMDVATVTHSFEALLAFLAIIIWHFYHVHFNPEVFPMSRVFLDGKMSEHEMKMLHPLEYERIIAGETPVQETVSAAADTTTVGDDVSKESLT